MTDRAATPASPSFLCGCLADETGLSGTTCSLCGDPVHASPCEVPRHPITRELLAATPASPSGYLPGMRVGTGGNALTPASPEPPRHLFVDSRGRNLCDTCDRWIGAPVHFSPEPASPPDTGLDMERLHRALLHHQSVTMENRLHVCVGGVGSCASDIAAAYLAEAGGPSR